jgi:hypothetical protein
MAGGGGGAALRYFLGADSLAEALDSIHPWTTGGATAIQSVAVLAGVPDGVHASAHSDVA